MPLDTPIQLGPNVYYFRGDLWTAAQLQERWGIVAAAPAGRATSQEKQAHSPQPIIRA